MEKYMNNNNANRIWTGLVLLAIGLVYLLKNIGVNIPEWVISWPALVILIGLLVGFKRKFHGGGWLMMILVGGFFMVQDVLNYDISKYYIAIGFIILGLFVIFKPKESQLHKERRRKRCERSWKRRHAKFGHLHQFADVNSAETKDFTYNDVEDNDIIDSVNVFGGSHQNIYSKNFKGGDVIAVFGGADINLTQADFEGKITLEIVAIFGGMKIIIPPDWEVKSEVTAIFGGIDDKRSVSPIDKEQRKILIIKGVALFGGVDIRNF